MNHFKNKLHTGAIGSQKTFREDFNKVLEILENIDGLGGITIAKNGNTWRISFTGQATESIGSGGGGIPSGYEEEQLDVVTAAGIKTRTVLVKTSTKADVVTPGSGNKRLVLQVTEPSTGTYAIGLDYVHLADEA
jgi:hypothetical protein